MIDNSWQGRIAQLHLRVDVAHQRRVGGDVGTHCRDAKQLGSVREKRRSVRSEIGRCAHSVRCARRCAPSLRDIDRRVEPEVRRRRRFVERERHERQRTIRAGDAARRNSLLGADIVGDVNDVHHAAGRVVED